MTSPVFQREFVFGGRVFKAHRLVYHSSLGWRVIKKKKKFVFEPSLRLDLFPFAGWS